MEEWNQFGKNVVAGIFIIRGIRSLIRNRHGYGGWTGDFFDEEGETILSGWPAATLNVAMITIGVSALIGFGWFFLSFVATLALRKIVLLAIGH
jgi:hypothetical protein